MEVEKDEKESLSGEIFKNNSTFSVSSELHLLLFSRLVSSKQTSCYGIIMLPAPLFTLCL